MQADHAGCVVTNNFVECFLGSIAVGDDLTVKVNGTVLASTAIGAQITAMSAVDSEKPDSVSANNKYVAHCRAMSLVR